MNIISKIIFIAATLSFSLYAQVGSGGGSYAREMGLGNTYTASSRGLNSIGLNPANLAIKNYNKIEISTVLPVPELNAFGGSQVMSIKDYLYYFGGTDEKTPDGKRKARILTEDDKSNLIDLFNDNDLINSDFSLNLFSIGFFAYPELGVFTFSIKDRFAAQGAIDKNLIQFMMQGNKNTPSYHIENMALNSSYLREYAISFAKNLTPLVKNYFTGLYAGITVKYMQGFAYLELKQNDVKINTLPTGELFVEGKVLTHSSVSPDFGVKYKFDENKKTSNFTPFPTPSGSGVGFDIGFTAELNRATTVALSITDIGSVNWTKEVVEYKMDGSKTIQDFTQKESTDSLKNIFDLKGKYIGEVSSSLPTALHAGISIRLDQLKNSGIFSKLLIAADYHQGFNNQPSNSTKPRISLGIEYGLLDWFNIRSGFSIGGKYGFRWSAGFGLDWPRFTFDITATDFNHLINGNNARQIGVAVGSKFRF